MYVHIYITAYLPAFAKLYYYSSIAQRIRYLLGRNSETNPLIHHAEKLPNSFLPFEKKLAPIVQSAHTPSPAPIFGFT